MKKIVFVVRLNDQERRILADLSKETGRSMADVVRRIVVLADTPTGRAALGIIEAQGVKP